MEFYTEILKNLNEYIFVYDEDGTIIWSNSIEMQDITNSKNKYIIKYMGKYYEKNSKTFKFNSKKYLLDEYNEITNYAVRIDELRRDFLTGLYTREKILKNLESINDETIKSNGVYSLVIGDIDFFKKVNDIYGHGVGDIALKSISNILLDEIGNKNNIGRYGGEEFIILLPGLNEQEAYVLIENIRKKVESSCIGIDDANIKITITFGISSSNGDKNIDKVLREADIALYKGKNSGRNKTVIYNK